MKPRLTAIDWNDAMRAVGIRVRCPRCRAKLGAFCRQPNGKILTDAHQERLLARRALVVYQKIANDLERAIRDAAYPHLMNGGDNGFRKSMYRDAAKIAPGTDLSTPKPPDVQGALDRTVARLNAEIVKYQEMTKVLARKNGETWPDEWDGKGKKP